MLVLRYVFQYGALALIAIWLMSASLVSAIDVTVSGVVEAPPVETPDTIIQFSGWAYPNATVTLRQDGTILTSTTAGSSAAFSSSNIVNPGTHTYTLVAVDGSGYSSSTASITVTLSEGATVGISNVFLSPSVVATASTIDADESALLQGTTRPSSAVAIYVTTTVLGGGTTQRQFNVTSNAQGNWSRTFTGIELGVGSHSIRARATSGAQTSEYSPTVAIAVNQVDPCSASTPGDINCDGNVDLVDFSILLFYWQSINPANARADINADTVVNVTDFSILLYYWTG